MGKQNNQYQGSQRQMNDYEKNRLLRVQENQARLRDLGVKSIANSLTTLVESRKTNKKKVKQTYIGARDVNYIPDLDDDSDGEYREVATSVEVWKKFALDSNSTKENQSRERITMGDLILSNKMAQSLLSKENVAEPNCIRSRAKRKLVLVDEDDEIYQDVNEADLELDGSKHYVKDGGIVQSEGTC
ncbi:hypothetical protein L2E82_30352 [Cichorium intybus]|uniref:Uncharacterized protein n=1 Tax=Cichorium intybus TaxID=13427 RepID=A0ACB9D0K5_CICIN|nr:hypothetical protein L2E82_30352 [Cichorium intybus]